MARPLVLIPTDLERGLLAPRLREAEVWIELCGFGIAAAAARAAHLLALHRPRRVILVGIAGRFTDRLPLGSAAVFDAVTCHGIGVGSGTEFVSAAALGWPHWPGEPAGSPTAVGDSIRCGSPANAAVPRAATLLTVAAASASMEEASLRRAAYPTAEAEDMEGFAVALACRLAAVPCAIVRGLANDAGDRDHARWHTATALDAAAAVVRDLLAADR